MVKDIRSGKTGYAWVIDNRRKLSLFIRCRNSSDKTPLRFGRSGGGKAVSFDKINQIQKEKMLQGAQGTSWYVSGWHRGVSGNIKKLIAYAPIQLKLPTQSLNWAVAVVAPVTEVDEVIHNPFLWQFIMQGIIICRHHFRQPGYPESGVAIYPDAGGGDPEQDGRLEPVGKTLQGTGGKRRRFDLFLGSGRTVSYPSTITGRPFYTAREINLRLERAGRQIPSTVRTQGLSGAKDLRSLRDFRRLQPVGDRRSLAKGKTQGYRTYASQRRQ